MYDTHIHIHGGAASAAAAAPAGRALDAGLPGGAAETIR